MICSFSKRFLTFVSLLIAGASVFARPAAATIQYRVSFDHPEQHLFHVTMTVPAGDKHEDVLVQLPAWNALYQVRDFAYRVRDLRETTAGPIGTSASRPEMLDKQTWRIGRGGSDAADPQKISITYAVQWDDVGPFDSQLNVHHAFINLAEILMYVPDRRKEDTRVAFENVPAGWNIVSELSAGPEPASFIAPSYDELVDAPVDAGKFDEFEFDSSGAHFRVVVDAANWNRGKLEDGLHRIIKYEIKLMGGAPFREFTFFFHIGPTALVGAGGMEHMNSTAIASTSVETSLTVAAHEFFHVWNVKRIRPQNLEPVDYTKEQYTRSLWFAEGFTDTYSAFTLERSGLWSRRQFLDDLATQMELIEARPAHQWQSAEDSSLDAWFEKFEGYNTPGRSISYYDKGQIIGAMLDLAIRDATDNRKSLDDVFRLMNDKFAKQGKFYDERTDIRAAVEEVSGKSFEDFFVRYISGVTEIPCNDFLAAAGLEIKTDAAISIIEIQRPTGRQRRIREGFFNGSTD